MKNTIENTATVTLSGFALNNIVGYANINIAQLLNSVNAVVHGAEHHNLGDDDLYYLTKTAIRIAAEVEALQGTITTEYENAYNNSKQ